VIEWITRSELHLDGFQYAHALHRRFYLPLI
jgi:hypothetical protein